MGCICSLLVIIGIKGPMRIVHQLAGYAGCVKYLMEYVWVNFSLGSIQSNIDEVQSYSRHC